MSNRRCMVLRSGASIAPFERNQHRPSQHQKQPIPESLQNVDDDDEDDEPLFHKRHRVVNSPPSTSHSILVAEKKPPVPHSISAIEEESLAPHSISAVVEEEVHSSKPATTNTTSSVRQQTMMFKFKLPPPIQSVQQQKLPSLPPHFRHQLIPSVQQRQLASLSSSQAPLTPVSRPLQPDMSSKASASLPLQSEPYRPLQPTSSHPLQSDPSRSTPKASKGRVVSEEQEYTTKCWRSAENRKDWITTGDNYARTRDVHLANASGGVGGVYREAAAFVRNKLPYLSETEFTGQLARKRGDYMVKKGTGGYLKNHVDGIRHTDEITLYEQWEALFPRFHELVRDADGHNASPETMPGMSLGNTFLSTLT
ncbi:MAG: hypothetical protein JOS17DRAFT_752053 [Linnemannia elongata]|nr:MAG: hypothetical protein JOS17DRAFT_752053 [Linnemannia elongata]